MTTDCASRYADATRCECGADIEIIDNGDGQMFWLHVAQFSRLRKPWDHAAVPERPSVPASPRQCRECKASVDTRHLDGCVGQFHEVFVADYRGGAG